MGALSPVPCALSSLRSQPQFPCAPVGCMHLVSVLGSWPLAATLPAEVDHPESQEVFGSLQTDWEPVCSLVGSAVSGAEFAPFPSLLPPASGRAWAGPQPASSSLVLLQSLFCQQAGSALG